MYEFQVISQLNSKVTLSQYSSQGCQWTDDFCPRNNFSKDEIMESVDLGMKPDKEIEEMAKDVIFDILKEIFHRNRENEDD